MRFVICKKCLELAEYSNKETATCPKCNNPLFNVRKGSLNVSMGVYSDKPALCEVLDERKHPY